MSIESRLSKLEQATTLPDEAEQERLAKLKPALEIIRQCDAWYECRVAEVMSENGYHPKTTDELEAMKRNAWRQLRTDFEAAGRPDLFEFVCNEMK